MIMIIIYSSIGGLQCFFEFNMTISRIIKKNRMFEEIKKIPYRESHIMMLTIPSD